MEADRYSKDVLVRSLELQKRSEILRGHGARLRLDSDALRCELDKGSATGASPLARRAPRGHNPGHSAG